MFFYRYLKLWNSHFFFFYLVKRYVFEHVNFNECGKNKKMRSGKFLPIFTRDGLFSLTRSPIGIETNRIRFCPAPNWTKQHENSTLEIRFCTQLVLYYNKRYVRTFNIYLVNDFCVLSRHLWMILLHLTLLFGQVR